MCHPEKNQKYEMMTQAKLICANDPSCSGLVEAPKRRGQQKKFGRYSLTEREYILCSYPLSSKATDDTLLLIKRGNLMLKKPKKRRILNFGSCSHCVFKFAILFRTDRSLCPTRNKRFEFCSKYDRKWLEPSNQLSGQTFGSD